MIDRISPTFGRSDLKMFQAKKSGSYPHIFLVWLFEISRDLAIVAGAKLLEPI